MTQFWLYDAMDRAGVRNYRAKIMLMAFIGTHIPLIALVSYFALKSASDWRSFATTVGVTLLATLVGTAVTLLVLNQLLRPVLMVSRTLRAYGASRDTGSLPTHYRDEVGTLMADTSSTIAHLEGALDALEHVDASSGLPNRAKLILDVQARLAASEPFGLCAIRFGNYRQLAATLDLAEAEAAFRDIVRRIGADRRLAALYRANDGDVVAVLDATTARSDEAELASWLQAALGGCSGTLPVGSIRVEPVLLAGIAKAPQDGTDADRLVDHALGALASASGEASVSFHSAGARAAAVGRLRLEQDLRRALHHDEFVLHYQPVVDVEHGRVVGAEALIRWQHPDQGLLAPGRFIGAAEASGLIDAIGLWVLRQTCRQIRTWNDAGATDLKVAINLSARQFLDPALVTFVDEAIRTSRISPAQLEVELTETAAMSDASHTKAVFSRLRDLGVSIAIDDFGTGYASMSSLRKLPFDKLKIDREFVTDVHRATDNQAICNAMIALGKGLGLRVLAEGTETEEEVRFLTERGCALFQGYFFSKPLPSTEFASRFDKLTLDAKAAWAWTGPGLVRPAA